MYKKQFKIQKENFEETLNDKEIGQDIVNCIKATSVKGQKRSVLTKDNTKCLYYKSADFDQSNSTVQTVIKNQADGYMKSYFVKTEHPKPLDPKNLPKGIRKTVHCKDERKSNPYKQVRYAMPLDNFDYDDIQYMGPKYDREFERLSEINSDKMYRPNDTKFKDEYVQSYIQYVQTKSISCETVPDDFIDEIPVRDKKNFTDSYQQTHKYMDTVEKMYIHPTMMTKSSSEYITEAESLIEPIKKHFVTVSRFVQTEPVEFKKKRTVKNRWTQTDVATKVKQDYQDDQVLNVETVKSNVSFTSSILRYSRIILFVTVIGNIVRSSIGGRIN